jgi:uncharacterized protein (DUF1501 family)
MLTLLGEPRRYCDGVSRRGFLQVGALCGGLSLAQLLAAEAHVGKRPGHKAVINVFLPGGPSHQDTFDLKLDAPSEIRGEFRAIDTNVPGLQICEHLPRIAAMMDRFAVVRSLVGARDEHANPICHSGYTLAERSKNQPSLGAIAARVWGPVDRTVPPFVDLIPRTQHQPYSYPAATGFLGRAYSAFRPEAQGMADMVLSGISLGRLEDRRRLLAAVDRYRAAVDRSEMVQAADAATQHAFDLLTSRRFVEALDVTREPERVRERFGQGHAGIVGDAAPCKNLEFLAARRLVEAGVRCVTLGYGFWDWHGGNFTNLKKYLPMLDQAVSALVTDLEERGLLNDVSVVVWGEFGRTPKINGDAGRDHWPAVSCALLAGGGMSTGQAIGSTTRDGGYADERPIHYRDVFATLLHNLGFDVRTQQVRDQLDRPVFLLEGHEPITELV